MEEEEDEEDEWNESGPRSPIEILRDRGGLLESIEEAGVSRSSGRSEERDVVDLWLPMEGWGEAARRELLALSARQGYELEERKVDWEGEGDREM